MVQHDFEFYTTLEKKLESKEMYKNAAHSKTSYFLNTVF